MKERTKKLAYKQKGRPTILSESHYIVEILHELHQALKLEETADPNHRDLFFKCVEDLKEYIADPAADDPSSAYTMVHGFADRMQPWASAIVKDEVPPEDREEFWIIGPFWEFMSNWPRLHRMRTIHSLTQRLESLDGDMERIVEPYRVRCAPNNPMYEMNLGDSILRKHPWVNLIPVVDQIIKKIGPQIKVVLEAASSEHVTSDIEQLDESSEIVRRPEIGYETPKPVDVETQRRLIEQFLAQQRYVQQQRIAQEAAAAQQQRHRRPLTFEPKAIRLLSGPISETKPGGSSEPIIMEQQPLFGKFVDSLSGLFQGRGGIC